MLVTKVRAAIEKALCAVDASAFRRFKKLHSDEGVLAHVSLLRLRRKNSVSSFCDDMPQTDTKWRSCLGAGCTGRLRAART